MLSARLCPGGRAARDVAGARLLRSTQLRQAPDRVARRRLWADSAIAGRPDEHRRHPGRLWRDRAEWRVVVSGSYWSSHFRTSIVQSFVDSLHARLVDPSGEATIPVSPVTLYDITFSGEARFTPKYSGDIKPFLGVGLAAHIINADGSLIDGTFVERALDDIATGLFVTAGASLKIVSHLGIQGMVRGDLLSGFRSTQVRGGATYYFGHVRGTTTRSGSP